MFYHVPLERDVTVHPKYFGPRLHETLEKRLFLEVEGTCDGVHGYIIVVTKIDDIGKGEILIGRGYVTYSIKFNAIVFRPVKGQVIDAIVSKVNNVGIFAQIGPMQCFVSRYNIPDDMRFEQSAEMTCYRTEAGDLSISEKDKIRLRLINVRIDVRDISAAGTIREDFLGKL